MTAEEDKERIERMKQIDARYGEKTVLDVKTRRRIYIPNEYVEQQEASKRFRGVVPTDE